MQNSINYNQIIKDCFWDYNMHEKDIQDILNSENIRDKSILFEKILANSTQLLQNLKLFKLDELKSLLENYKIPRFNSDYLLRRKNIVEYFYFDKPLEYQELKWIR